MRDSLGEPLPIREHALYRWEEVIADAKRVVADDASRCRDEGSCVLGAGIAIDVLPKRCRLPQRRILISAPFQGNVGSQKACKRALALLRISGLDAYWYDGIID